MQNPDATQEEEQAPEQKGKRGKRMRYLYVFVQEDHNVEQWVKQQAYELTGDYREEGMYDGRPYFLRKERGKQCLVIFYCNFLGFEGSWYLGPELGGSSSAWSPVTKGNYDVPPEKGWQMRNGFPGFSVDCPLQVKVGSIVMHEVHAIEATVCAPCHVIRSLGHCAAGACLALANGTTEGVDRLERHPLCTDCMEGMLREMSCYVPIAYAFEQTVDAWYRAMFINGFCHTASYEHVIRQTRSGASDGLLRSLNDGYSSPLAAELACNEPFLKALEDLLYLSGTRSREHARWAGANPQLAAIVEETGCHVPFRAALHHLVYRTRIFELPSTRSGSLSMLGKFCAFFCGQERPKKAAKDGISVMADGKEERDVSEEADTQYEFVEPSSVKPEVLPAEPQVVVQSRELKASSEQNGESGTEKLLRDMKAEIARLEQNIDVRCAEHRELTDKIRRMMAAEVSNSKAYEITISSHIDKVSEFEGLASVQADRCKELEEAQKSQLEHSMKQLDRIQELEESLRQAHIENTVLQTELNRFKQESQEVAVRAVSEDALSKQVKELEAEIRFFREAEYKNNSAYEVALRDQQDKVEALQRMASSHEIRCMELEQSEALSAQKVLELRDALTQKSAESEALQAELGALSQRSATDVLETTQDSYIIELDAQIRALREAEAERERALQLAETSHQEKARELELMMQQVEIVKTDNDNLTRLLHQHRADSNNLAAELDIVSQGNVHQVQTLQNEFEEQYRELQAAHEEELRQLQMSVDASYQRSVTSETRLLNSEEALRLHEDLDSKNTLRIEELEVEIASLRAQLAQQANPNDEYKNATLHLRELSNAMEVERAKYCAQVEELEGRLVAAIQDANALRSQLANVNAGDVSPRDVTSFLPPSPSKPTMRSVSPLHTNGNVVEGAYMMVQRSGSANPGLDPPPVSSAVKPVRPPVSTVARRVVNGQESSALSSKSSIRGYIPVQAPSPGSHSPPKLPGSPSHTAGGSVILPGTRSASPYNMTVRPGIKSSPSPLNISDASGGSVRLRVQRLGQAEQCHKWTCQ